MADGLVRYTGEWLLVIIIMIAKARRLVNCATVHVRLLYFASDGHRIVDFIDELREKNVCC